MTVGELIARLQTFRRDRDVVIIDECGYVQSLMWGMIDIPTDVEREIAGINTNFESAPVAIML